MRDDTAGASAAAPTASLRPDPTSRRHAVKLRPAASIALIDTSGTEPKVLLGRRHARLAFLPGKYVFPGGRLETGDRLMNACGSLSDTCLEKLACRRPRHFAGPQAFALAAIRELFEETGLLVGKRSEDPVSTAIPRPWHAFAELGFAPDLSALRFIARAVTPPGFARRFDTSFFAVDVSAIAHHVEGCVHENSELVELVWLPFAEAGKHDIPAITAMILLELEARIAANFAGPLPVPFFYKRQQRWIRDEL